MNRTILRLTERASPHAIIRLHACLTLLLLACANPSLARAARPSETFRKLAVEYKQQILPVLKQYCNNCHSPKARKGDLDLQRFVALTNVRGATKVWIKVAEMLDLGEMPPVKSKQPSSKQRKGLRGWVRRYLRAEALANAGDPGPVVLRRLNNAEFTYTVRDLTGVKLNPARGLPSAGAAGEGFTNVGNALVMSPALLRKYLDAGKGIASHVVLLPDGFRFSRHNTRRDWTNEIVAEIRAFYGQFTRVEKLGSVHGHPKLSNLGKTGRIPIQKYLAATLIERQALSSGRKTIKQVAASHRLNAKYLGTLWGVLNSNDRSVLLLELRKRWRKATAKQAAELATYVKQWQKGLWTFNPVGLHGRKGSRARWLEAVDPITTQQTFRTKIPAPKKGQKAKEFVLSIVTTDAGDGNQNDFVIWQKPKLVVKGKPDVLLRDALKEGPDKKVVDQFGKHPNGTPVDPASLCVAGTTVVTVRVPAKYAGRELVTTARLHPQTGTEGTAQVDVVPGIPKLTSTLLTSEVEVKLKRVNIGADERNVIRHRPILVTEKSQARKRMAAALNAHRRVFPAALCYTQIVPADEFLTLQLLHRDDGQLIRLMLDKSQRAHIHRLWSELRYVSLEPLRLSDVLDSLLETTIDHPQEGIFNSMIKPVRKRAADFRKLLIASETHHVNQLMTFAERIWRRPLSAVESDALRRLYQRLRKLELPHDEAFRLTMARVFVAAPFLYKLEAAPESKSPGPVSNWELANRLSYFLWSSLPDERLRTAASQGKLNDPQVLLRHTRRMLKDARIRRLAVEFGCQWLHIHDFPLEKKSGKHFPEFASLRVDMYEESILFLTDMFRQNSSLLNLLDADHTFLNERLAKFYGVKGVKGSAWRRVQGVRSQSRGGILAQATFLAKQSGTTRTSPILRGNWVSEVLLGEKLPRPPKNVPQLADSIPAGLTERQLIERHSKDVSCAKCHRRIDPFGFALEGFDAIGRTRKKSPGGLIDTKTTLPDGAKIEGLTGLKKYLLGKRRTEIVRQFCRKLLGYALGRELQLSDQPLVERIVDRLTKSEYRVSLAVEAIVLSKQFRMIRGKAYSR